jgi:hypothetical protein
MKTKFINGKNTVATDNVETPSVGSKWNLAGRQYVVQEIYTVALVEPESSDEDFKKSEAVRQKLGL